MHARWSTFFFICQIPVINDLPVGENLQDHMFFLLQVDIDKPYSQTPDKVNSWSTWLQYHLFGTGECFLPKRFGFPKIWSFCKRLPHYQFKTSTYLPFTFCSMLRRLYIYIIYYKRDFAISDLVISGI